VVIRVPWRCADRLEQEDVVMSTTCQPINLVVLRGQVRAEPVQRELPSGSRVVQFDVATEVDGATSTAPVSMTDPPTTSLEAIAVGADVVVFGGVRRRFFRVDGRTQSRTEVVAQRVVAARRTASVNRLLTAAAATIDR
jgi:hypothetical protein